MIIESTFANMLASPRRHIKGRVEIFKDSTPVLICDCHNSLMSFTVERAGEKDKFFGYGICQKLTVKLRDKERQINIDNTHTLEVEFGVEDKYIYPCPLFYIDKVERDENTNELTITAYDSLYKATHHTVSELDLRGGYSIKDFTVACASLLGLPLAAFDYEAFNTYYPTGANFEGTENVRTALNAIAEATQTIYYVDKDWNLTFKRLDVKGAPVATIDKSKYMTLTNKDATALAAITHATELGDNITASSGAAGATQFVRNNPFWDLRDDVAVLVDKALAALKGISITGFELVWRGNFLLEIGDKIGVITKDNNEIITYVLDDSFTFNGGLSSKMRWSHTNNKAETPSNPTTLGESIRQTYARVDKANKRIDLVASDVQEQNGKIAQIGLDVEGINLSVQEFKEEVNGDITEANEAISAVDIKAQSIELMVQDYQRSNDSEFNQVNKNMSALQVATGDIKASVEKVTETTDTSFENVNKELITLSNRVDATMTAEDIRFEISQEVANGTSKVITATGFTFDETGLTVEKSNSEMKTQITEDGMEIFKNDEAVLKVDNTGVKAKNLHATTYLIVGTKSRFEDYESNRTGCFWIGG